MATQLDIDHLESEIKEITEKYCTIYPFWSMEKKSATYALARDIPGAATALGRHL